MHVVEYLPQNGLIDDRKQILGVFWDEDKRLFLFTAVADGICETQNGSVQVSFDLILYYNKICSLATLIRFAVHVIWSTALLCGKSSKLIN